MALTKIGASLGGGADTIFVTQAGHGLTLGYPVKANNNGTYAHATANTAANAEAIGIIIESTTDTMLIALSGRITVDGCVPNLSAGTVLFLQVSAGLLAAAEPSVTNQVSKPMAVITYANSEMILLQQRGEVITTGVIDSHTVASHSDTTGTGAELETLTDGSNAESLHTHTHTVASHSDTATTGAELTLLDGGTSVGSSITIVDADGFIVNDGGTMKTVPATSVKTYAGGQSFTGDTTITSGNLVIATPGKGIDFSAQTGTGSGMSAELLNHYEEGTATVTMGDDDLHGTNESQEYAIQVFHYQRVGNRVSYALQLRVTDTDGLDTGQIANVLGLPFASNSASNTHNAVSVGFADSLGLGNASETLTGRIPPNTSYIQMFIWDATAGTSGWLIGEVTGHGQFVINGDYRV